MNFLKIREGFPCFVMTALDDEAIRTIDDVNVVYVKGIMRNDYDTQNAKADFIDRIISQAQHYQSKIAIAEEKLSELLKSRYLNTLSATDEKELIELDSFLENAIDGRSRIPDEFKTLTNSNKLEQLIESVDNLINEIDGKTE